MPGATRHIGCHAEGGAGPTPCVSCYVKTAFGLSVGTQCLGLLLGQCVCCCLQAQLEPLKVCAGFGTARLQAEPDQAVSLADCVCRRGNTVNWDIVWQQKTARATDWHWPSKRRDGFCFTHIQISSILETCRRKTLASVSARF